MVWVLRIVDAFACGAFQELPLLYLKGGSIVPMGPVAHYVGEKTAGEPLTLIVALDHHGTLPKPTLYLIKAEMYNMWNSGLEDVLKSIVFCLFDEKREGKG
jgi:alpha-glucosidase (family GH31 glycosyl hydrolase)